MLSKKAPASRKGLNSISSLADSLTGIFGSPLETHFDRFARLTGLSPAWLALKDLWLDGLEGRTDPSVPLGKLGLKDEPGKVRVFAMVDPVTQWMLYPLHLAIFDILRKIRQDATFDQEEGIRRLKEGISSRRRK